MDQPCSSSPTARTKKAPTPSRSPSSRRRLAACVNILPRVQSIYRWQGTVESATEIPLFIKSTAAKLSGARNDHPPAPSLRRAGNHRAAGHARIAGLSELGDGGNDPMTMMRALFFLFAFLISLAHAEEFLDPAVAFKPTRTRPRRARPSRSASTSPRAITSTATSSASPSTATASTLGTPRFPQGQGKG